METLFDALFEYAMKTRVDAYLLPLQAEWEENEKMVLRAAEELKQQGFQDEVERIQYAVTVLSRLEREAFFRAGVSIGLDLSRM